MGKNIIICDDAAFMRMMLKDIVTKGGYTVVGEAANGKEAIVAYEKEKPDVLLMDITMPEMDGITALKEIRKKDPDAIVIMLSAMGENARVIEAMKAGARDALVKPFLPERVLDTLKKISEN